MKRRRYLGVAGLAGATLILEISLTRLLAVAQFYHFAFLVVSLALLGFGASGSFLALAPRSQRRDKESRFWRWFIGERLLFLSGAGFAISVGVAYGVVNVLPFDSYAIAWDWRQVFYFILYYLALTTPFLFSGVGIGGELAQGEGDSHNIYAANLLGSGIGALCAPAALWLGGVPGGVILAGIIGLAVSLTAARSRRLHFRLILMGVLLLGSGGFLFLTARNLKNQAVLGIAVSPYKNLAQALRYPGSRTVFSRWNAISRVDVVRDAGTRQLPGLSYVYSGSPPPQLGLSIDAADIQPITQARPEEFDAGDYLPEAVVFELQPDAGVLVLNPGGGLGVLQAAAGDAEAITAVLGNPLLGNAVAAVANNESVYRLSPVNLVYETPRVLIEQDVDFYDLILVPLTDAYRPVTSGAYSLSETYDLTVESFNAQLDRLAPEGIWVATRWLQTPPSESIRLAATVVEAMEERGVEQPEQSLIAYRGIQTLTVLAKPAGWTQAELGTVRSFLRSRRFDLVWAPDIDPAETNRFNRLPTAAYYDVLKGLFEASEREDYYRAYSFTIRPAVDDQPFFFHFFTWQQTPELLATIGKIWQPFGGSGYLILFALLILVLVFSAGLILGPLIWLRRRRIRAQDSPAEEEISSRRDWRTFMYFGLIGLAFLFIEIPLIQRWILFLGNPTYAFTLVVFALLTFSGLGSALSRQAWIPQRIAFGLLILASLGTPWVLTQNSSAILSWSMYARIWFAFTSLAPLGLLMGLPFPLGLVWLEAEVQKTGRAELIPWAWAVNGCVSVIASVLAAILALSYGFTMVLALGAAAYAGAGVVIHLESGGRIGRDPG